MRSKTRRDFIWQTGGGFANLALLHLLTADGFFARKANAAPVNVLAPKPPHFPAKAKRAVFLFMNGAPSAIDTFDYKPALTRYNGTPYKGKLAVLSLIHI